MSEMPEPTAAPIPCPTCGRTYGQPVDVPDRCGCCLTGLSIDGRPVHPVRNADRWISPLSGSEVLQLPDGTFTHRWSGSDVTAEQQIAHVTAERAAGRW